jgi:hypothetical protein
MQAANMGRRSATILGIPVSGFGLFASLLLALGTGLLAFFTATCIAIFVLLAWNLGGRHAVSYADSYLYVGVPAGLLGLVFSLAVFLILWARAKLQK